MKIEKKLLPLLLLLLATASFGATNSIRFQGRLTDSQGKPIVGTISGYFEIFDAVTNGNRLGDRTPFPPNTKSNESGLFITDIGPFSDMTIFSGQKKLYVQITIKGGTGQSEQILSPRQELASVPFSFHAEFSDRALSADNVGDESITTEKIKPGAVGSEQIADRSVQPIDLSTTIVSQIIPSGMVSMFSHECPVGWTRYELLDDRFPRGVKTNPGEFGGSAAISGLEISTEGAHKHTVDAHTHGGGSLVAGASSNLRSTTLRFGAGSNFSETLTDHTHPISGNTGSSSPQTDAQGNHTHKVFSDGSWEPPYVGMIFCEKD